MHSKGELFVSRYMKEVKGEIVRKSQQRACRVFDQGAGAPPYEGVLTGRDMLQNLAEKLLSKMEIVVIMPAVTQQPA
jgi:hypothetical protein